jgi:hypothetical protein
MAITQGVARTNPKGCKDNNCCDNEDERGKDKSPLELSRTHFRGQTVFSLGDKPCFRRSDIPSVNYRTCDGREIGSSQARTLCADNVS